MTVTVSATANAVNPANAKNNLLAKLKPAGTVLCDLAPGGSLSGISFVMGVSDFVEVIRLDDAHPGSFSGSGTLNNNADAVASYDPTGGAPPSPLVTSSASAAPASFTFNLVASGDKLIVGVN